MKAVHGDLVDPHLWIYSVYPQQQVYCLPLVYIDYGTTFIYDYDTKTRTIVTGANPVFRITR